MDLVSELNETQPWLTAPFDLNGSVGAANISNQTEPYYDQIGRAHV